MAEASSSESEMQQSSIPSTAAGAKKRRSPVERAVVWGLMVALGIAVLIEGRASLAFKSSYERLQARLDEAEQQDAAVTESDVKALVTGYSGEPVVNEHLQPNLFNARREDVYTFAGLIKTHLLYVYYGVQRPGKEREVLHVSLEKVGPLPFEDFELPPPDVRMGPPSQYNIEEEGAAPGEAPATDASTTDERPDEPNQ